MPGLKLNMLRSLAWSPVTFPFKRLFSKVLGLLLSYWLVMSVMTEQIYAPCLIKRTSAAATDEAAAGSTRIIGLHLLCIEEVELHAGHAQLVKKEWKTCEHDIGVPPATLLPNWLVTIPRMYSCCKNKSTVGQNQSSHCGLTSYARHILPIKKSIKLM